MWWVENPIRSPNSIDDSTPIVTYHEDDTAEWDSYVLCHPAATVYHLSAWRRVLERSFGHRCINLVARQGGVVVGILPLTLVNSRLFGCYLVSTGFADVGGICADDNSAAESLLEAAFKFGQNYSAEYLELRQVVPLPFKNLVTNKRKVIRTLKLPPSVDVLMSRFDKKLRNQIRKAQNSGLKVVWGNRELIKPFYDVFSRNMRDLGTPVIKEGFFTHLVDELKDQVEVVVLFKDNLPVSGAVGLYNKQIFEVPWASSRRDFFSLSPNVLLYWAILQHCIERGSLYFNFGRSSINSGTDMFKKQWGTDPISMNYQSLLVSGEKLLELNPSNPKYNLAIKLWQKLPLELTRLVGPWLGRNLA